MLECTKCLLEKEDEEFPRHNGVASRRHKSYWCRSCHSKSYFANKDRHKATVQKNRIRRRYDMTVEEYDALISRGCALCGKHEDRMVMDHCHATGKVRAALCDRHNKALGFLDDDVDLIRRAADYIAQHAAII